MSVSRRSVFSGEVELAVWEWPGATDRTAVVVHGHLDSARLWEPVAARLCAAGWRVVAPDLRGHGDSAHVGQHAGYNLDDLVLDLFEVTAACAPQRRIALVGHSLGGLVAARYAASFPERVSHLALLEGVGAPRRPPDRAPAALATWIAKIRLLRRHGARGYDDAEMAAQALRATDPRCTIERARELVEHYARCRDGRWIFKHDPFWTAGVGEAHEPERMRPYWQAITCPTLLLDGEKSWYRTKLDDLEERYAAFRRARRVSLADVGHSVGRDAPELVAAHLLALFAEPS